MFRYLLCSSCYSLLSHLQVTVQGLGAAMTVLVLSACGGDGNDSSPDPDEDFTLGNQTYGTYMECTAKDPGSFRAVKVITNDTSRQLILDEYRYQSGDCSGPPYGSDYTQLPVFDYTLGAKVQTDEGTAAKEINLVVTQGGTLGGVVTDFTPGTQIPGLVAVVDGKMLIATDDSGSSVRPTSVASAETGSEVRAPRGIADINPTALIGSWVSTCDVKTDVGHIIENTFTAEMRSVRTRYYLAENCSGTHYAETQVSGGISYGNVARTTLGDYYLQVNFTPTIADPVIFTPGPDQVEPETPSVGSTEYLAFAIEEDGTLRHGGCVIDNTTCRNTPEARPDTINYNFPGSSKPYATGDTGPGGGIVFHVTNGGLHGLEAARVDQNADAKWCPIVTDIPGVEMLDDASIEDTNSGAYNTPLIEVACGASSAAGIAAAYVWPNGQTDGFLPNKDELYLLYLQRVVVGGFSDDSYWSSSMSTFSITAWDLPFSAGIWLRDYWDAILSVRAVRAF